MKSATVLSVLLCLSASASAFAQGGSTVIEACYDYAARAVSQVQMAKGCNFEGPRWTLDSAAHAKWCTGTSTRERGREDDERRKALMGCRGDVGSVPIKNCNEYVARARSQMELADALGPSCKFEGMRWSENVVQHMNWCTRNPSSRQESEDAARRKELAACKATPK